MSTHEMAPERLGPRDRPADSRGVAARLSMAGVLLLGRGLWRGLSGAASTGLLLLALPMAILAGFVSGVLVGVQGGYRLWRSWWEMYS